ncbi:MAG: isoprenylcysteine carboxylmethyltransferase family protein [Planctomycetes bacterium]|nr:isoprenylcysteine carboxylmethyltransferase family protein [Planctomycetota bacterium]
MLVAQGGRVVTRLIDRVVAILAGLLCHGGFLFAVGAMAWALAGGMQTGLGRVPAPWASLANLGLALQFPLLHSVLLTSPGRALLGRCVPGARGRTLVVTTFVIVTSAQLAAVFLLWTPTGTVWYVPAGLSGVLSYTLFLASWMFLVRAIHDAGAGLQSGAIGWWALFRGRRPHFGGLPTEGLFRTCRQPIYLGFLLVLLTAPTRSADQLLLVLVWGPYCILAPRLKERRFLAIYGDEFAQYQRAVPYFVPFPWKRHHDEDHRGR